MKDIIITGKRRKKELKILLVCFIVAFLTNIIAIIIYKTTWHEVFSQMGYVVVITLGFYLIVALFRLLVNLIKNLFGIKRDIS